MYWSRTLIPTTREAPAEAEILSHQLMIRAGLVRRLAAGIYDWLPLGWRAMQKVCRIMREEMNRINAEEVQLPAVLPAELWKQTGRYFDYGPLLFKLKDRKDTEMILGPTHEEVVTELVKASISSHKQLPLTLYQIQQKFRDEARPRSGLLRVREFYMKDAYSFHTSVESLQQTYQDMFDAYVRIFKRCGVPAVAVEAESGPIGGDASHEFICACAAGEDIVARSEDGQYAANLERAERQVPADAGFRAPPAGTASELELAATPGAASIENVCQVLGCQPDRMIKTLVFQRPAGGYVVACVRGDHEVNEAKLRRVAGPVQLADDAAARTAGFVIGFVGPHVVNHSAAQLVVDPDALAIGAAVTGANQADYHVTNFNWIKHVEARQRSAAQVADIRNVVAGDKAPNGSWLKLEKGIELGHVFKLGTKYSQALEALYLDEKQQSHPMIMGCYGIGPGRIIVAALETLSDKDGIVWPMGIAPFQVIITPIRYDGQMKAVADDLHNQLTSSGVDVLLDDRDQRPGVKFKDADLIGIPLRIVVGEKGLAAGQVELKRRATAGAELVSLANLPGRIRQLIDEQLSI